MELQITGAQGRTAGWARAQKIIDYHEHFNHRFDSTDHPVDRRRKRPVWLRREE
jgi:hypothetical protein